MNEYRNQILPHAIILPFPKKRGRPRIHRAQSDTGTPELVMKRLKRETAETLDLCLEHNIITQKQHWCGIHLRWLYTLRFGTPGVRAVDPTHLGGMDLKLNDPTWREARESEYQEAMQKLTTAGHTKLLMSICIYNERPAFLSHKSTSNSLLATQLQEGLELLATLWRQ